jgi:hypothetical protein
MITGRLRRGGLRVQRRKRGEGNLVGEVHDGWWGERFWAHRAKREKEIPANASFSLLALCANFLRAPTASFMKMTY